MSVFRVLDLLGTFTFALNGSLTAVRAARLDIVGVVTLGMITALGGGIVRDVMLGALPPATFGDATYLAVAGTGALLAFGLGRKLERVSKAITLLDAAGLSLFAVAGAGKALAFRLGPAQAAILGAVTGVGGGTLRDVLLNRIPIVLRSELYAIPALAGAALTVVGTRVGLPEVPATIGAAAVCFIVRMLGVRFDLHAPGPPGGGPAPHRRSDERA